MCLLKFDNIKYFTRPLLNYKPLKLQVRVFVAGQTVAMVTYSVTNMIVTYSPMIGQFFNIMIVASSVKI